MPIFFTIDYNACVLYNFSRGIMEEDFEIVELDKGKYTFKMPNGQLLSSAYGDDFVFLNARDFCEGFAAVETNSGWTHMDKNGKLFDYRYDELGDFHRGFAHAVKKIHVVNLIKYFPYTSVVGNIISLDDLPDKLDRYIDKYGVTWSKLEYEKLQEIYETPETLFTLDEEMKENVNFIKTAIFCIKQKLEDMHMQNSNDEDIKKYKQELNAKIIKEFPSIFDTLKDHKIDDGTKQF